MEGGRGENAITPEFLPLVFIDNEKYYKLLEFKVKFPDLFRMSLYTINEILNDNGT